MYFHHTALKCLRIQIHFLFCYLSYLYEYYKCLFVPFCNVRSSRYFDEITYFQLLLLADLVFLVSPSTACTKLFQVCVRINSRISA